MDFVVKGLGLGAMVSHSGLTVKGQGFRVQSVAKIGKFE